MKLLDTLSKTKKAIGGVILILLIMILIFFAGTRYAKRNSNP